MKVGDLIREKGYPTDPPGIIVSIGDLRTKNPYKVLCFHTATPIAFSKSIFKNNVRWSVKVGDLVKGAYDKDKYRTGIILRIAHPDQYGSFGLVAHVLWTSTPVGLYQTGPAWVKDLEKL